MSESLHDLTLRSHLVVEAFLNSQGYAATAAQLRKDASACGVDLPALGADQEPVVDIKTLVEQYTSSLNAHEQARTAKQLAATHALSAVDPLSQKLAGVATLPYQLKHTHSTLHASNILSISHCSLPKRHFDTSLATYTNMLDKCIATTAADKRIVFSDAESGEMLEILEHSNGHQAAVLSIAQDPSDPRCLVSSGMDSKVVVWDLITREPIQTMTDHTKFVVRTAFSPDGEYLATAAYDRKIILYRRKAQTTFPIGQEDDEEDFTDLQGPRYEKVHEIETATNPEAILFILGALSPNVEDEPVPQLPGTAIVREARQKRTWLAYTVRSDCFIHYLALPRDADQMLGSLNLDAEPATEAIAEDWSEHSFNTNANAHDLHVSYSLMALSLHPSGLHICVQTGDHSMPNMASTASSSSYTSSASLSRLLMFPLLSPRRAATIWTGVATSSYAVPRHAWLPSGTACWLTSEDGVLTLVDLQGKTRASVLCHGLVQNTNGQQSEAQQSIAWSRGGNTIIKDVVVLDEQTVASCGFDRTVRVLNLR